ncbi:MAG: Tim44 domain-containing protein [Deltaproteobacteria bacterium]|nr:Tim44 domain-containing protein [Deltaproteobacteria bacterium]
MRFGTLLVLFVVAGIVYWLLRQWKSIKDSRLSWRGQAYNPNYQSTGPGYAGRRSEPSVGLQAIRERDPEFDEDRFKDLARETFRKVWRAWERRELRGVRGLLLPDVYQLLLKQRQERGEAVISLEGMDIRAEEIAGAWREEGRDYLIVRFRAAPRAGGDGTGAEPKGAEPESPVNMLWTFVRNSRHGAWRIGAITESD